MSAWFCYLITTAKHAEERRITSDSTLAPGPNLILWDQTTLLVKFMEEVQEQNEWNQSGS